MSILALSLFLWGYFLPSFGFWLGDHLSIKILPNKKPFDLTSSFLRNLLHAQDDQKNVTESSLTIASISFWSLVTGIIAFFFNKLMECMASKRQAWFFSKFFSKSKAIEKVFCERAPIEYQLVRISEKYKEDFNYNKEVLFYRHVLAESFSSLNKKEKEEGSLVRAERLNSIREVKKELKLRALNYALITLENGKTYICLPLTIPPPDEEAISANSISVIPVMSGYRDNDKALKFTTRYDFDLHKPSDVDCISIDREKIVTVSGFSFETYYRLNPDKEKRFGFYKK